MYSSILKSTGRETSAKLGEVKFWAMELLTLHRMGRYTIIKRPVCSRSASRSVGWWVSGCAVERKGISFCSLLASNLENGRSVYQRRRGLAFPRLEGDRGRPSGNKTSRQKFQQLHWFPYLSATHLRTHSPGTPALVLYHHGALSKKHTHSKKPLRMLIPETLPQLATVARQLLLGDKLLFIELGFFFPLFSEPARQVL